MWKTQVAIDLKFEVFLFYYRSILEICSIFALYLQSQQKQGIAEI